MLMKELKEKKYISHRLYKYLFDAFQSEPKNLNGYFSKLGGFGILCFVNRDELTFEYLDEMSDKFANLSLEEVLKELDVSEPEDIMQFRGLGEKSVSELRDLIERIENESKAVR